MPEALPGFFSRLAVAFCSFWRVLVDSAFADSVDRLRRGVPAPEAPEPILKGAAPDSALQLLGLFQQAGRIIDFLEEEVTGYSDAEVGAAARVVHEGCRRALREHFVLEPARLEAEGARLTLDHGFDPSLVRLTGNVVGEPPYRGTLVHRGWRVSEVRLPMVAQGHDLRVVAPAEVEL
ncbi:MAG: DUF2760 domain-containing protein [Deltaproteobacteria bacterium]|nr:DUF2760 domain-containing protein [Deltaproteobacteria bacterium]